MNKLAFATIAFCAVIAAQGAFAQSPAGRDREIQKLTDSRDMSTGLPMNAPARVTTGVVGGTARDRAIARNTDSRDMSTGLDRGAPVQTRAAISNTERDRRIEMLTDSRDMSTGFAR